MPTVHGKDAQAHNVPFVVLVTLFVPLDSSSILCILARASGNVRDDATSTHFITYIDAAPRDGGRNFSVIFTPDISLIA